MEIYLFPDGGEWVVAADGAAERFGARSQAFAAARDLARHHSPSRIVRDRPPNPVPVERPRFPADVEAPHPDDVDISDFDDEDLFGDPAASTPVAPTPARNPAPVRTRAPATTPAPSRPVQAPQRSWEALAGPPALGRSVLVAPGDRVPAPWSAAERLRIDAGALDNPDVLARVRGAFLSRTATVYEIDPPDLAPTPSIVTGPLWDHPVDLELTSESAWALLTANAVDGRDPTGPTWTPAAQAVAAGATFVTDDTAGDVLLPDGRVAWCDGGPLRPFDPDTPTPGTVVVPRVTLQHGRLDPIVRVAPTAELAPDQLAAVADDHASARIIAPAGSGKTRVLTERARYLLGTLHIPADALCLVAFNKRAQLEMQERTRDLRGLQVQTLNALALAVLNGGGGFLDRGRRVRTIDELEVRNLLGELVTFPRRANTDPAAAWIDALSSARLGLRDPRRVETEFGGEVDGFAEVLPRYRRVLERQGIVDFDEQIASAIEVLLTEPETRRQAQRSCQVLLVDEFQDLTPAHLLLIRLLAGPELAVFGVGDDDQTIYGYSGASPRWLIDFDHFFPGADHRALEVNYRCPTPVVAAAANLLSHNAVRVPKQIRAATTGAAPEALRTVAVPDPTTATVARVHELLDQGAAPTDIAVLTRVNTLLAPVLVALHADGVPVTARDGTRFLERTGVAAVLSWLRLAGEPERLRGRDIQQAARRPGRSLSPRILEWMGEQDTVRGLERLAGRLSEERDRTKVEGFVTDLRRIATRARDADTATLVEFVRSDIGLDRAMQTLDAAHRGRNTAAHADDLRALIALGRLHPDPTTFEPFLRQSLAAPRADDGVTLATVHTVKGQEWPHVVVHDATQGLFPHRLSTDVEEERRVFHVALTRCSRTVTMVADVAAPSMFLTELDAPAPERTEPAQTTTVVASDAETSRRSGAPEVAAVVGLDVGWGGYDCSVLAADAEGVTLAAGRASFAVAYGSAVTVDGAPRTLVAPPRPRKGSSATAATGDEDPAVVEALKTWRLDRSRQDKVPAYVVLNDKTLNLIATVLPSSAEDLLGISGIGPSKLERYGDEILAVVDSCRT